MDNDINNHKEFKDDKQGLFLNFTGYNSKQDLKLYFSQAISYCLQNSTQRFVLKIGDVYWFGIRELKI